MTLHQPIASRVDPQVWQIRVSDFLVLQEKGSFTDYARAELLDGEIWVVNAIHSRHAAVQGELFGRLWSMLGTSAEWLRAYVTPSVEMNDRSLPEPDIVIAETHDDGFLPVAKVRLVVEVSDTTLDVDLGRKMRVYADGGIAEYWVVDVEHRTIHQMWSPTGDTYAERREVRFGEPVTAAMLDGLTVETTAL